MYVNVFRCRQQAVKVLEMRISLMLMTAGAALATISSRAKTRCRNLDIGARQRQLKLRSHKLRFGNPVQGVPDR